MDWDTIGNVAIISWMAFWSIVAFVYASVDEARNKTVINGVKKIAEEHNEAKMEKPGRSHTNEIRLVSREDIRCHMASQRQ